MTSMHGRLVSKTDYVMHFASLVKQESVDLTSDLDVYYRLGTSQFDLGSTFSPQNM